MANELATEKMMTTREVAEKLGTSTKVVLENARKCLPNKKIENGKSTFWTEREAAMIVETLKTNQPNGRECFTYQNLWNDSKGSDRCEKKTVLTTRQLAKQCGTTPVVILGNARKCLPNKKIENGKPTYWTEEEVTVLLEQIKTNNNNQYDLSRSVKGVNTSLTPVLKVQQGLKQAQDNATTIEQQMEIANAGMQALAKAMTMLKGENVELKHQVEFNKVIGFLCWKKTKTELGIKMNFKTLVETYNLEEEIDYFEKCMGMDKRPTKLISPRVYEMLKREMQGK